LLVVDRIDRERKTALARIGAGAEDWVAATRHCR
jgi:hypothetical protein